LALIGFGTRIDEEVRMIAIATPAGLTRLVGLMAVLLALGAPRSARADPLFGYGEDALEDAFVDGDLDEEDHVAARLGGHTGASDVHGESWVSVVGFTRELLSGRNDVGGFLLVGLALDRMATGPVHRLADPPRHLRMPPLAQSPPTPTPGPPAAPAPAPAPPPQVVDLVPPAFARDCVSASLQASGLGLDDARIDALVSRARVSALLPETRMRAMRLWDDANHSTTVATTDTANFYDAVGANLVLELRLTWRLDRLLYAGDEGTLERVRLERLDARTRLATHTLEVLFTWERATLEARQATSGSPEELSARLRAAEAQATLDVMTAGWFSARTLSGASGASGASSARDPP
jgi:hypothetical protein